MLGLEDLSYYVKEDDDQRHAKGVIRLGDIHHVLQADGDHDPSFHIMLPGRVCALCAAHDKFALVWGKGRGGDLYYF